MQKCVHLKYCLDVCVTVEVGSNTTTFAMLNLADAIFKSNVELAYDDRMIDDCGIGSCYSFTVEEE